MQKPGTHMSTIPPCGTGASHRFVVGPSGFAVGPSALSPALPGPAKEQSVAGGTAPKLKLLDQVRMALRARHYSRRTEEAYVYWIKRFIFFHGKRHPREMGEAEINSFLTHLAVKEQVAASTQNQALAALLFLYRNVLRCTLGEIKDVVRARKPVRLPVVMTRDEVKTVLNHLKGDRWLMAAPAERDTEPDFV